MDNKEDSNYSKDHKESTMLIELVVNAVVLLSETLSKDRGSVNNLKELQRKDKVISKTIKRIINNHKDTAIINNLVVITEIEDRVIKNKDHNSSNNNHSTTNKSNNNNTHSSNSIPKPQNPKTPKPPCINIS